MDFIQGEQLSLIAEEISDYGTVGDWSVDVDDSEPARYNCPPLRERSHEQIRAHFVTLARGGQFKNSPAEVAPHDGGQTVERGLEVAPHDGGQNKKRGGSPAQHLLCDRSEGDEGTWIEIDRRNGGDYKYLRWRECSGKKRSKYLGKV